MQVGEIWQHISENPLISGVALALLSQIIPAVRREVGRLFARLRKWAGKGLLRVWKRIRSFSKLGLRYKMSVVTDRIGVLEAEVERLRQLSRSQLQMIDDNRLLELESRRDAYVRICREVAPHIDGLADPYEPKLVVSLHLEDGAVQYHSIKPSGSISAGKWIADRTLSAHIQATPQRGQQQDIDWKLGVVGQHGEEFGLTLGLNDLQLCHLANRERRTILHVRNLREAAMMRALVLPLMLGKQVAARLASKDTLLLDVPR